MKEEIIADLESLIEFGWGFVDREAAKLYEEQIKEIIAKVEKI